MNGRVFGLIYGSICYILGMGSLLIFGAFLIGVPESIGIDRAPETSFSSALLVNLALLVVFSLQHSIMARPEFKKWWTRYVPRQLERSTYILFSAIAVSALSLLWQPMGGTIWQVEGELGKTILYSLYGFGWFVVVLSTFFIDHFDLFGLRQVYLHFRGRGYTYLKFQVPGFYKYVRHPLYVGWITLVWSTPHMTIAHLLLAIGISAYILIAIRYEERDLVSFHGEHYSNYQRNTPMLVPSLSAGKVNRAAA